MEHSVNQRKLTTLLLVVIVVAIAAVQGQSPPSGGSGGSSTAGASSGLSTNSTLITPDPPTPEPLTPIPPTTTLQIFSASSSGVLTPGGGGTGGINTDDEEYQNLFNSPFYNDSDSLISAKSTALGAAFISGVSGNPLNSVHIARSTTLLGICKPWENRPLPLSQLPFVLAIGDHGTRYYAGAATINPIFLLVFTGLNALVCFSYGKAVAVSFSEARRKLRFPNTAVFPFVFLIQPSTMCALTVLLSSDDIAMLVTSSFSMLWWVVSIPLLGYFIHKKVPPNTRFVANYRHETLDSKAQKKLLDAVMEIDTKRREREAERERLREENERKIERESSIGTRLKTGTTGMLTQLAGIFATMARDEEEEERLKREEEERRRREAEEDSDEEMLGLIEKQAQFEYARMLSTTLDDTSLDDESALTIVLKGNDRWVDFAHNDEEEDDDNVETIDVDGIHESIGFVRKFGLVFARYRQRFKFFCLCELVMSLACGLLEGWRPTDPSFSACVGPSIAMMVLFGCYFSVVIITYPSISTFEHIFNVIISGFQFTASIFVVVAIFQEVLWAQVTTYVLAVICIYLCALKSLVDLYAVLAPYFSTKTLTWNTIKPLTRSYLDNAEDSKRKRDERSKRKRRLTRFKKTVAPGEEPPVVQEEENLLELVETTPDQQAAKTPSGEVSPTPTAAADNQQLVVPEVISGDQLLPPAEEGAAAGDAEDEGDGDPNKKLQTVAELVGEERVLSMNNRFRCSRGVPESLHPFLQRPLPPILPLPVRSAEESKRRHELLAKSKRKEYWSSTLAGVFDGDKKEDLITTTAAQDPNAAAMEDPGGLLVKKESTLTADSDETKRRARGKSSAWIKAEAVSKMIAPPKRRKHGETIKDRTNKLLGLAGLNSMNFDDDLLQDDEEGGGAADDIKNLEEHDDALAMEEGGLLELDYDDRNDPEKVAMVARKKREAKLQKIFGVGHNRQNVDKPAWTDVKPVTNMNQASFAEARLAAEEERAAGGGAKNQNSSTSTGGLQSKVKKATRFYKIMDALMLEHKADEDQKEKKKALGDDGKGTTSGGVRGTLTADNIQMQALLDEKARTEGQIDGTSAAGEKQPGGGAAASQLPKVVPAFAKKPFDLSLNDDEAIPKSMNRKRDARPDLAVVSSGALYPTSKSSLKSGQLAIPQKPSQYLAQKNGGVNVKKGDEVAAAADDLDEFFPDRSNSPIEDNSSPPPAALSAKDKQKSSLVHFDKQVSIVSVGGASANSSSGGSSSSPQAREASTAVSSPPQTSEEITAREVWGALVSGRQKGRERHLEEQMSRQGSTPGNAFANLSSNAYSPPPGQSSTLRRQNTAALSQRPNQLNGLNPSASGSPASPSGTIKSVAPVSPSLSSFSKRPMGGGAPASSSSASYSVPGAFSPNKTPSSPSSASRQF